MTGFRAVVTNLSGFVDHWWWWWGDRMVACERWANAHAASFAQACRSGASCVHGLTRHSRKWSCMWAHSPTFCTAQFWMGHGPVPAHSLGVGTSYLEHVEPLISTVKTLPFLPPYPYIQERGWDLSLFNQPPPWCLSWQISSDGHSLLEKLPERISFVVLSKDESLLATGLSEFPAHLPYIA